MKRFSENGARPASVPGGGNPPPIGRLGALVFQPNNSDTLWWASLRAQTRIAGCALGSRPRVTRWENVSSEERFVGEWPPSAPTDLPTPPGRLEPSGGTADKGRSVFRFVPCLRSIPQKTSGRSPGSCRKRMHPQSTGGLSAQVALLQSPILSAAETGYGPARALARQIEKTMMD